jgi:hypothetical protein
MHTSLCMLTAIDTSVYELIYRKISYSTEWLITVSNITKETITTRQTNKHCTPIYLSCGKLSINHDKISNMSSVIMKQNLILCHLMNEDWNVNGMALLTSFCIHINTDWIMCGFTCMFLIEYKWISSMCIT